MTQARDDDDDAGFLSTFLSTSPGSFLSYEFGQVSDTLVVLGRTETHLRVRSLGVAPGDYRGTDEPFELPESSQTHCKPLRLHGSRDLFRVVLRAATVLEVNGTSFAHGVLSTEWAVKDWLVSDLHVEYGSGAEPEAWRVAVPTCALFLMLFKDNSADARLLLKAKDWPAAQADLTVRADQLSAAGDIKGHWLSHWLAGTVIYAQEVLPDIETLLRGIIAAKDEVRA